MRYSPGAHKPPLTQATGSPALLATLVDIKRFLDADRDTAHRERAERDSRIGQALSQTERLDRVLAWWQQIDAQPESEEARALSASGAQLEQARKLTNSAGILLGLFLGISVTTAALTYTGDYPVNLLTLLGVLVLLPLLMLALTLIGLLPGRATQSFADALAGMNPVAWLARWLQQRIGWSAATLPGWQRLARWQLVLTSQLMAVAFFLASLITLVVLVALSDLAFGWSTTLSVESDSVAHRLQALAWPWQAIWPAAVPSSEMVANSQFFRLDFRTQDAGVAAGFGAWWPFVLMCISCYGLLPRVALLLIASIRLRRAEQNLLLNDPDVTALLDRMDSRALFAQGEAAPLNQVPDAQPDGTPVKPASANATGRAALIIWNDATTDDSARALAANNYGVAAVSISHAHPGDDASAIAQTLGGATRAIVVTKGWEPPLLEFTDFLADLISAAPTLNSLSVLPRALTAEAVSEEDARIWSNAVARLADPRIITLQATTTAPSSEGAE